MPGRIVLVTGVTRYLGSAVAGRLAADPRVERVIGVDAALPEPPARARMQGAEFVRADIRNALIARVIDSAGVDTVVHASATTTPAASSDRAMSKEINVLGTMQLLAACQRSASVTDLIVRSTAMVYGGSSRDPAVFSETTPARLVPSRGFARDAVDIEGYVRGFGRRRPDVRVAVPRFAEVIGPTVRTPLTRYFALTPLVPVLAGRNARLQLVHETDAAAVLAHLALGEFAGTVNVAGDGVLTVRQAIERAGRIPCPMLEIAVSPLARALKVTGVGQFSPEVVHLLKYSRVLDTSRLRTVAGYVPQYTTAAAFAEFAATIRPAIPTSAVRRVEVALASVARVRPRPGPVTPPERRRRPRLVGLNGAAGGER